MFWDREQSEAFLSSIRELEPKWYPFFLLALRTGMRQGELFGLQWGDLDFVKRKIHIKRAMRKRVVHTPKNNRFRMVPMTDQVHDTLKGHRHLKSRDWVFTRDDGRPLTRNAIKWAFWRMTRAAGLPEIRFHDLRHTTCTRLLERGASLAVVASIMGWSASTTAKMAKRYGHIGNEAQRAALEALVPRVHADRAVETTEPGVPD